jgi:predicted Zn-dependent protease
LFGHLASLRVSRGDEKEADLLGMRLAADAGFDPKAALTLLQKASRSGTGTPLDWLSTHPLRTERLKYIGANLGPNQEKCPASSGPELEACHQMIPLK